MRKEASQNMFVERQLACIGWLAHGRCRSEETQHEVIGQYIALGLHVVISQGLVQGKLVVVAQAQANRAAQPHRVAEVVLPHMGFFCSPYTEAFLMSGIGFQWQFELPGALPCLSTPCTVYLHPFAFGHALGHTS
jgi:hypothetical protein